GAEALQGDHFNGKTEAADQDRLQLIGDLVDDDQRVEGVRPVNHPLEKIVDIFEAVVLSIGGALSPRQLVVRQRFLEDLLDPLRCRLERERKLENLDGDML